MTIKGQQHEGTRGHLGAHQQGTQEPRQLTQGTVKTFETCEGGSQSEPNRKETQGREAMQGGPRPKDFRDRGVAA